MKKVRFCRKEGRALGITKEVAGQQKSMENWRQQRKAAHPWLPQDHEVNQTALVTE
jgi:hypothetical protein